MNSFAERLREERQRLGLNQTDFAAAGGVKRDAQQNYESGLRRPDSAYLEAIAVRGVDVAYLLTGQRSAAALRTDEEVLLAGYRALDTKGRAGVLGMIAGMTQQGGTESAPTKTAKVRQNFEGANIGQHVTGDVTAPFSINMGGSAGRKKKRES
ncbi:helix-turn-helix domain-containing protein [Burkholderia multivorans]|uniref:helix-turn-helix domain-containing protein n=1 Tax=Burkholderia multivorans TaxID=87883 RepID=UPI00123AF0C8|nr:helix-turn-helix transcriptional regulator [Burkholderia multivorans]MBU9247002.1 helix-turn-helix domain-containing protein [Burkholderia multivorans]MCL4626535.1 helix-turn-helix domain-containing protein [Burkholderia multivorans]MCO1362294.1 helix-turn-helix domain-containing protein [Burkholderia multivorans]MCO1422065.1 helix-turn-helix domain-containing protein [Burkholderia multivorans]QET30459.1 helix-turn-helix domain-containing protein [Burkholderia multivorans]